MIAGWAGNYVVGKIALQAFSPVLLFCLRISMAGVLILPVYWWERRHRPEPSWTLRDVTQLVVLGLFGVALNQFLFVVGLSRTSVAHSSIFANMTPILILLLASARGLERLTGWKLLGVTVALAGVVLLRKLDTNSHGEATLAGDFLTFCGALAFSIFTVLAKPQTKRYGGITVNTFAYAGGGVADGAGHAVASGRIQLPGGSGFGLGRRFLYGVPAVGDLLPHLLLRAGPDGGLAAGGLLVPAAGAGNRVRDPGAAGARHVRAGRVRSRHLHRRVHYGAGAVSPRPSQVSEPDF